MTDQTIAEAVESLKRAAVREWLLTNLNGHAPQAVKAKRKVSAAGRARQIAAMKAYWRKRRATKAR